MIFSTGGRVRLFQRAEKGNGGHICRDDPHIGRVQAIKVLLGDYGGNLRATLKVLWSPDRQHKSLCLGCLAADIFCWSKFSKPMMKTATVQSTGRNRMEIFNMDVENYVEN